MTKTNDDLSALYGEDYYKTHCSSSSHEPYERSPLWLAQFANLAEAIIRSIGPKTAFDAGCAWGFLVESLRDRGVEAHGMDISSYAISNVRPDMRKFCSVGSLTEPLPGGPYDLVSCIEVLEHLPEEMADAAIANLCAAGDTVLFSSSPDDFAEPTHFNVNPSIYWLRKFAACGFAPDVQHDASYLTPHAVLFRRAEGPIDDAVLVLHARKQMLANEVAVLKGTLDEKGRSHLRALAEAQRHTHEANLAYLEASSAVAELTGRTAELEGAVNQARHEAERLRHDLHQTLNSVSWKVTRPLRLGRKVLRALRPLTPFAVGSASDTGAMLDPGGLGGWFLVQARVKDGESCALALLALLGETRQVVPMRYIGRSGDVMTWLFHAVPGATEYQATVQRGTAQRVEFLRTSVARAWGRLFYMRMQRGQKEGWSTTLKAGLRSLRNGSLVDNMVNLRNAGQDCDYTTWLALHDTRSAGGLDKARAWANQLALRPVISVVMPTYKTEVALLEAAIESVKAQVYDNWELCIADDASNDDALSTYLRRAEAADRRIKVCFRDTNGHISAASNSALALATGEFIALMDHDDELHPFALAAIAGAINEQPDVDVLYSDEDKIDRDGNRYDPYFKPQWNPDLLLSQNYISHLGVYRRTLVEAVGGFREGYEGSQDYDLVLRVTERTDRIRHVPHVLYHWRAIEGSTALATNEKSYACVRAEMALTDALKRRGLDAEVVETGFGAYNRVRYALPADLPQVSLIVPTKDRADLLEICLRGLLEKTDYPALDVIIVDNNSTEAETFALFERLQKDSRVTVVSYPKPFNYSAINNFAAAQAKGSVIGLINNDIEVIESGWLKEMVSQALRPEIGAVGARLCYPDNRVQHDGIIIGMGGVAGYAHPFIHRDDPGRFGRSRVVQNYSAVTAAVLVLRKEVYDAVGGLDESLAVAFNDVDFCLRIREAGYRNLFTPFAQLYHHESISRGPDITPEKIERFRREVSYMMTRWEAWIANDPCYNPNLPLQVACSLDMERSAPYPWDAKRSQGE